MVIDPRLLGSVYVIPPLGKTKDTPYSTSRENPLNIAATCIVDAAVNELSIDNDTAQNVCHVVNGAYLYTLGRISNHPQLCLNASGGISQQTGFSVFKTNLLSFANALPPGSSFTTDFEIKFPLSDDEGIIGALFISLQLTNDPSKGLIAGFCVGISQGEVRFAKAEAFYPGVTTLFTYRVTDSKGIATERETINADEWGAATLNNPPVDQRNYSETTSVVWTQRVTPESEASHVLPPPTEVKHASGSKQESWRNRDAILPAAISISEGPAEVLRELIG